MTRTPFKFIALRPANCLATACKCFSTGLQSCTTAGLPLQNCLPVSTSTTVTSESWPLARAGLPSPGPGSPSDPEGPCRRRHGRRGWGGGARTGRPTPAGRCFPSFASILLIPFKSRSGINAGGAVVEQPCRMREVLGSNPAVFFILPILIY